MTPLAATDVKGGARFSVRVQPRSSRNEVAGLHGGALRIRLSAPPVDGAANAALVDFLAEWLGVGRRDVALVAGLASRTKVVEVRGLSAARLMELAANPQP